MLFTASISVITLVHGRRKHLLNMLRGLSKASPVLPAELVIVHMNQGIDDNLPRLPFPVHQYEIRSTESKIPLAKARNMGASKAQYNRLVFLDVDCIPEENMLARYQHLLNSFYGLLMGDIRYLPEGAPTTSWNFDELTTTGKAHPRRPVIDAVITHTSKYELFWSLNFALDRKTYQKIEGFDERYQGYGGEDTDFAFCARKKEVPFALCDALCYHQHHPVYKPPLQHFHDIIINAECFYQKWHRWPMDGWLAAFADRGFINWTSDSHKIEVLNEPTQQDIDNALYNEPAGF